MSFTDFRTLTLEPERSARTDDCLFSMLKEYTLF